jgi:hypothetical protein
VAWDTVDAITDIELVGVPGFYNEMLFTVSHRIVFGKIQELDAGMRHFRAERFVTEVEAKEVGTGFANDPGQNQSCRKKIEVA